MQNVSRMLETTKKFFKPHYLLLILSIIVVSCNSESNPKPEPSLVGTWSIHGSSKLTGTFKITQLRAGDIVIPMGEHISFDGSPYQTFSNASPLNNYMTFWQTGIADNYVEIHYYKVSEQMDKMFVDNFKYGLCCGTGDPPTTVTEEFLIVKN